jgi:hypothetical protein
MRGRGHEGRGEGEVVEHDSENARLAITRAAREASETIAERDAEIVRLRAYGVSMSLHLASIITHWDEFGAEHGFDETIAAGRAVLTS